MKRGYEEEHTIEMAAAQLGAELMRGRKSGETKGWISKNRLRILNASKMSEAELTTEVKKGFDDIAAGRKCPLADIASSLAQSIARSEAEIDAGNGLDAKKALSEMRATLRI